MDLTNLIDIHLDLPRLAKDIEEIGPAARSWAIAQFNRHHLARLFEAAQGFRPVSLGDLVPPEVAPRTGVLHEGKNSLPACTHFYKRFCRLAPADAAATLVGYNLQPFAAITGPGYFLVHPSAEPGALEIDYTVTPTDKPADWPAIAPSGARLGWLVYGDTVDVLRGISSHLTVGRAKKKTQWRDTWFVLVREDPRSP